MDFVKKRLLFAAHEAGAGSLLAQLIEQSPPSPTSQILASRVAQTYFHQSDLTVLSDDVTDNSLSHLIDDMSPDRVVLGASVGISIEKRLFTIAREKNVEIDVVVDHYWNLWQRFADPETAKPWRYVPDRIYVPAPACAQRLVTAGFPANRIEVFAHPSLKPNVRKADKSLRAQHCHALGIPSDAVIVLFISETLFVPDPKWVWDQAYEEDYHELLKALLEYSARHDLTKRVYVLVRPHPSEPATRWESLCQSVAGSAWLCVPSLDKDFLFAITDMAFGLNSMLMLEAAAVGIPTYSLHTFDSCPLSWLSTLRSEIVELENLQALAAIMPD
jgi:hypothetical protein